MQKYVPLPLAYCSENFRIISKLFSVAVSDAQKPRATRSRQSSLPFPPSSSSPRSVPVFARLVSSSSSSTPPIAPIGDTHHHPSPTRARSHPPSHPRARASSSSLPFIPSHCHHTPRRALERSVGRARGRSRRTSRRANVRAASRLRSRASHRRRHCRRRRRPHRSHRHRDVKGSGWRGRDAGGRARRAERREARGTCVYF